MINFREDGEYLILEYVSDYQLAGWIDVKLSNSDEYISRHHITL
ncbi:MAG: hypothetical protein UW38_C0001G0676 [Candidatus Saccharibacteria bacterium GW2011_GWC2_44_17]|nr:MAG: hypothetical protein UW38_C0001G0676 [Candidatus Saccharibacteria bacterium GW2011_GWC2_44_17]